MSLSPVLDVLDLGRERVDLVLELGLQDLDVLDRLGRVMPAWMYDKIAGRAKFRE